MMKRRILWVRHILALTIIGLLCVSFGGCTQEKTPEEQVLEAIKSGDYDEALSIIGENAMVVQDEAVIEQIETRIAELQSAYESGIMDYDDVTDELAAIGRLDVPNVWTDLQEVNEYVESIYLERNFQKVWLCTSNVTKSNGSTTKKTWDYDESGRLAGFSVETTHLDAGDTIVDYFRSYAYEYNDDGKISGVVISDGQDQYRVEAIYSNNRLVEYVGETGEENGRIYFEYDAKGNIVKQEVEYDSERTTLSEMSYHSNGELAEKRAYTGSSYTILSKFDENGHQIENAILSSGDYLTRTIMEYNAEGRCSYQASYGMGSVIPQTETRYEYDSEGHISIVSGQTDGKEFYSEGVWDPIGESMAFLNWAGFFVKQYYDEYGNCTSGIQYDSYNEDTVSEQDSEYIMLYLPFNYEKPDLNDPRYLIN